MGHQNPDVALSEEMRALIEMRSANSEAFSILGTELAEVKAMLMVLLDLQKSAILSSGFDESELEVHVQTLLKGYRARFLAGLSDRIQHAAEDN